MACNVASVAARLLDQLRMRSWIEHWCGICWRQSLEAHSVISASSQSAAMRVLAAILPLLAIAYCQPSPPSNLPPDLNTEVTVHFSIEKQSIRKHRATGKSFSQGPGISSQAVALL